MRWWFGQNRVRQAELTWQRTAPHSALSGYTATLNKTGFQPSWPAWNGTTGNCGPSSSSQDTERVRLPHPQPQKGVHLSSQVFAPKRQSPQERASTKHSAHLEQLTRLNSSSRGRVSSILDLLIVLIATFVPCKYQNTYHMSGVAINVAKDIG